MPDETTPKETVGAPETPADETPSRDRRIAVWWVLIAAVALVSIGVGYVLGARGTGGVLDDRRKAADTTSTAEPTRTAEETPGADAPAAAPTPDAGPQPGDSQQPEESDQADTPVSPDDGEGHWEPGPDEGPQPAPTPEWVQVFRENQVPKGAWKSSFFIAKTGKLRFGLFPFAEGSQSWDVYIQRVAASPKKIATMQCGKTTQFEISLSPGSYRLVIDDADHRANVMIVDEWR